MARPVKLVTKPCEGCGISLTKTGKEAAARKYWTCGAECSHKVRIQKGRYAASWQPNRYRGEKATRPCARCGRLRTRYLTEKNHDAPWYCSRDCAIQTHNEQPRVGKGDHVNCVVCGESFYRMPGEVREGRKYCSRNCTDSAHALPLVRKECAYCGEAMFLQPSVAETRKYCCAEHWKLGRVVRPTGRMHNGKPVRVMPDGYVKLWEPEHPRANRGWIPEHIYVMEQHLGRSITRDEEVDHKDGVRSHNDVANLQVLTKAEHRKKTWEDRRDEQLRLRAEAALARRLEREQEALQQQIAEKEAELAVLRAQVGVR